MPRLLDITTRLRKKVIYEVGLGNYSTAANPVFQIRNQVDAYYSEESGSSCRLWIWIRILQDLDLLSLDQHLDPELIRPITSGNSGLENSRLEAPQKYTTSFLNTFYQ
jgi:hypothetical protein